MQKAHCNNIVVCIRGSSLMISALGFKVQGDDGQFIFSAAKVHPVKCLKMTKNNANCHKTCPPPLENNYRQKQFIWK